MVTQYSIQKHLKKLNIHREFSLSEKNKQKIRPCLLKNVKKICHLSTNNDAVEISHITQTILHLSCHQSAIASQLRHQKNTLLLALQHNGFDVTDIHITNKPITTQNITPQKNDGKNVTISVATLKHLSDYAQTFERIELRHALKRLFSTLNQYK